MCFSGWRRECEQTGEGRHPGAHRSPLASSASASRRRRGCTSVPGMYSLVTGFVGLRQWMRRPVRRADNFTIFLSRLSWNLGASTSWNPLNLSRPVVGLLFELYGIRDELQGDTFFAYKLTSLTFKRWIKSHRPFAGIIRSSPYSPRFQDKG